MQRLWCPTVVIGLSRLVGEVDQNNGVLLCYAETIARRVHQTVVTGVETHLLVVSCLCATKYSRSVSSKSRAVVLRYIVLFRILLREGIPRRTRLTVDSCWRIHASRYHHVGFVNTFDSALIHRRLRVHYTIGRSAPYRNVCSPVTPYL